MRNRNVLVTLLLLCLTILAAGLFIGKTGPLAINALTAAVREQLGRAPTADAYPSAATIEENGQIERYRMRLTVRSEGSEQRPAHATVEGRYTVNPPAEELTVTYEMNGATESITMTTIDGIHYMQQGEIVVQTPDAAVNIQELMLIAPQDTTELANSFTLIGEEESNGRTTLHYQGDPKALHTDGTIDLSQLDTAAVDVWVDTTENFIVAIELRAYGLDGNPDGLYEARLDYFDFNASDIIINAPELTNSIPQQ